MKGACGAGAKVKFSRFEIFFAIHNSKLMLVICKRKPPKYYYYTRRKHQQQLNSMITTLLVVVLLLFMSVSRSSAASASNKIQYVKPSVRSHAFLTPKHGNITLVQGWLYSAASDKNDKLGLFARP